MTLQRRRFVSWPTSRTLSSGCGRARELVRHHQRNSQWRRDSPPPAPPWWWTAGRRVRGLPTPLTAGGDPGAGLSTSKTNETTGRDPADNEVPVCPLETVRRRQWRQGEQSGQEVEEEGEVEGLSTTPAWRLGPACRPCTSPSPPPAWSTRTTWAPLMEIIRGKHRK